MDVVFNHTAEGNEMGPTISFRGFDNRVYYMIAPKVRFSDVQRTREKIPSPAKVRKDDSGTSWYSRMSRTHWGRRFQL